MIAQSTLFADLDMDGNIVAAAPFIVGQWLTLGLFRCRVKFAHAEGPDAYRLTLEYIHPTPAGGPWFCYTVRRHDGRWWHGPNEVRA